MADDNPYFDKESEVKIRKGGNLPHWEQSDKIQYVTFRLGDSLPKYIVDEYKRKNKEFLTNHPEPWDLQTKTLYSKMINRRIEEYADTGYGSCIFKDTSMRKILSDAFSFRDSVDYSILSYVIMPNHVHLLMQLLGDTQLKDVMHSIKGHTARRINRLLSRSGKLWMREGFDRLIRSREHLEYCLKYIRSNPRYLKEGEYTIYENSSFIDEIMYCGEGS